MKSKAANGISLSIPGIVGTQFDGGGLKPSLHLLPKPPHLDSTQTDTRLLNVFVS